MSEESRPAAPHVRLLTGAPGVGKTTVIKRLAMELKGRRVGGFYTEEIRERGARRGFRLVDFAGDIRIIAHVTFATEHRVGRYGVNVAAIDDAASLLAPDPAVDVYLVDEIGKMECLSERFVAAMRVLLDGPTPVVAAVAQHGDGLIAEVKQAKDHILSEVSDDNRDTLAADIRAWLEKRWSAGEAGRG